MEVLHALFLPKSEIPKPKPGTMKTLNLNPKPKKKPCPDLQEDLSNINSPRLVQKTLRFYRGCLRFQRGFDKIFMKLYIRVIASIRNIAFQLLDFPSSLGLSSDPRYTGLYKYTARNPRAPPTTLNSPNCPRPYILNPKL